jgi:hypothetical protein
VYMSCISRAISAAGLSRFPPQRLNKRMMADVNAAP